MRRVERSRNTLSNTEPVSLNNFSRRDFVRFGIAATAGLDVITVRNLFAQTKPAITSFSYNAPQSALDDLKRRLAATNWTERETVDDQSQGVPLRDMRALVDYWRDNYDWRRAETSLNQFPQFRTDLDGLGIHFIHARSKHANALPIILTHGWPSTILLFREVIGPLTDPTAHGGRAEDAFHVVVPSLPGFAFSDKPRERGWNAERTARAWAVLMERLGYRRYVSQGGDWGAYVATAMGQQRPKGLLAIHLNFPRVIPNQIPKVLSPKEKHALEVMTGFREKGSGYFAIQSTRPQAVGYALVDSPAGLAGWIYDIYIRKGTDNRPSAAETLSRDTILDEITLYWLTGTGTSSARFYFEQVVLLGNRNNPGRVDIPVACSIFPGDLPAPRSWAKQVYPNLIYWNELDRGGHFAALEEPVLFVDELRKCFRQLR